MQKLLLNPFRLLNSVLFGILLMAAIAVYIAIGSGSPNVRAYFEMTELQFFNAWPMKTMLILLVINLVTVTFNRIPFTPPRYGVWLVHSGIITLILGTSFYYRLKVEGTTRIFANPASGPTVANAFYDKDERALFIRAGSALWNVYALPSLPRFSAYDAEFGNAAQLSGSDLKDIKLSSDPAVWSSHQTLAQAMGLKNDVTVSVIGYYPYANLTSRFEDGEGTATGIRVTLPDIKEMQGLENYVVGSDPQYRFSSVEGIEHREVDAATLNATKLAAAKLFHFDVSVKGKITPIDVSPGQTYNIDGYTISLENYEPNWPMFGTNERVNAMTLKVTSPAQTFRRMVLDGRDLQTDFKLDDKSAGPMGKRQKAPLDSDLVIRFSLSDPYNLLPSNSDAKRTLITVPGEKGLTAILSSFTAPTDVKQFDSGAGDIEIKSDDATNAPFLAASGTTQPASHPPIRLHVERKDKLTRIDSVSVVPIAQRTRDEGESGLRQVVRLKVTSGDWATQVLVPFTLFAAESQWDGGLVTLPDGKTIQFQLGNTRLPLPARLTLNKFELVPYPGGDGATGRGIMRDFRSELNVFDPQTGDSFTDTAHMNNPVYFHHGSWLFFQAAYDPDGQRWTILGVGNRPGVWVMTAGCLMMIVGLLYAFYAKPFIVRRMKRKAIEAAMAKKVLVPS